MTSVSEQLKKTTRLRTISIITMTSGICLLESGVLGRLIWEKLSSGSLPPLPRLTFDIMLGGGAVLITVAIFLLVPLMGRLQSDPDLRSELIDERTEWNGQRSAVFALLVIFVLDCIFFVISRRVASPGGELVAQLTIAAGVLAFAGRYLWLRRR